MLLREGIRQLNIQELLVRCNDLIAVNVGFVYGADWPYETQG